MKTKILFHQLFVSTALATLLALVPITFAAAERPQPAVKNSFWQVAKHLELGGSHYSYQSHEQVQGMLDLLLAQFPKKADPQTPASVKAARKVVEVLQKLRNDFGLGEISGTGASSFAIGKDLVRNRTFTHHYPGQDKGLMWRLFGTKPHAQEVLKIMPRETAAMFHTDLDLPGALDWVENFLKKNYPEQAQIFSRQIMQLNQQVGLERLLASYGGEVGAALVLDERAKLLNLPPDTKAMPRLLLMVKVKDDTLRKFLVGTILGTKLGETVKVQGVEMTVMNLPPGAMGPLAELGVKFQPALFQVGGYLVLASDPGLATRVMATQQGRRPGLVASPEFQKYAKGLDLKGNQIRYISPRAVQMGKDSLEMIKRSMFRLAATLTFTGFTLIELVTVLGLAAPLAGMSLNDPTGLTVMRVLPDGLATEGHGAAGMVQQNGVPLPAVMVVVGVLGSMLLPALARAKAKANVIKSVNNISQLGRALHAYARDNKGRLPAADKWCDAILPEAQTVLVYYSPQDPETGALREAMKKNSSYAMNAAVAGKNFNELPPDTVLIFECPLGWNGSGGLADIQRARAKPGSYRQLQVIAVTLADGSSRQTRFAELGRLNWTGQRR